MEETNNHHHYALCPQCDLLVGLSHVKDEYKAICPRCHTTLLKNHKGMKKIAFIYSLCGLVMLLLATSMALIDIRLLGNLNSVSLTDIPHILYKDHYAFVSALFIFFVLCFPILTLVIICLLCKKTHLVKIPRRQLLIFYEKLTHWCMPEIFLVGILVSFVKLMSYGEIGITKAFLPFCLFVFFYLKSLLVFSPQMIWDNIAKNNYAEQPLRVGQIGMSQDLRLCLHCYAILPVQTQYCPRCKKLGHAREAEKIQWTIALIISALLIYIPANAFGIMITNVLGSASSATILDGIFFMWKSGDIPVALVIFCASIAIPILKIISLSLLCYFTISSKQRDLTQCLLMNRLYNIVEFIGKWSMIDIFVVAVVCSLVKNQQIISISPDSGIIYFAIVVIVTMIASHSFDPRLIWDRINFKK